MGRNGLFKKIERGIRSKVQELRIERKQLKAAEKIIRGKERAAALQQRLISRVEEAKAREKLRSQQRIQRLKARVPIFRKAVKKLRLNKKGTDKKRQNDIDFLMRI